MIKTIAYKLLIVLGLLALTAALFVVYQLWKYELFKTPVYETEAPQLPAFEQDVQVLMFSKTNSYRHLEAIPAAEKLFDEFANSNGWDLYITENAAVHNPELLSHFDLIIWNNVTGDVLTQNQRVTLQSYMEKGGKFLGLHGTGGNEEYEWQWVPDNLIRAQFTGHPVFPQFRDATLITEDLIHPATAHMPKTKLWYEEWYSFEKSPRGYGADILITVDETEYQVPEKLKMGRDHPLVWHHKVGKGTVFYSALGHRAEAYQDKDYRALLGSASLWLLQQQ
ncbi:ThuA domain-containing protein [Parendozoicomonas sp. Alg238-R29]|uniref:ThuA domain-containing protein n=1 Tax=Parendozoicomonas sp. Alg238-R29 TaxID=2993446 RepID=UPI00248D60A6|nr:ThuA domain-containing protein [Parendozoicomonas sp. Alg238-R29]